MPVSTLFTDLQKELIKAAIVRAEKKTSGEIKVHIEKLCEGNVLDRACVIFKKLGLDKTEARNGVLFYLAVNERKFAILGDTGINAMVDDNFWDNVKVQMQMHFRSKHFTEGLISGIEMAGEVLQTHFPYESADTNEISDEISFGQD
jgi:uncharacterized membrane protein